MEVSESTQVQLVKDLLSPESNAGYGLQVVIDTIAYGQNLPLRLLDINALKELPELLKKLISEKSAKKLLQEELNLENQNKDFSNVISELENTESFDSYARWIVGLSNSNSGQNVSTDNKKPSDLWMQAILILLPHLEHKVWLTEMGNPLPAHLISRMVEHWSLYVLCWCYLNLCEKISQSIEVHEPKPIDCMFDITHYKIWVSPRIGALCTSNSDIRLIAGPIWCFPENNADDSTKTANARHAKFTDYFQRFISAASKYPPWQDAQEKAPDKQDLENALEARMDFTHQEAEMRTKSSYQTLVNCLLTATWNNKETPDRADWENIAALACWFTRNKTAIMFITKQPEFSQFHQVSNTIPEQINTPQRGMRSVAHKFLHSKKILLNPLVKKSKWVIGIDNYDVNERSICLRVFPSDNKESHFHFGFEVVFKKDNLQNFPERLNQFLQIQNQGAYIDTPNLFFNRLRERQQAGWTAQIIAINNLLNAHSIQNTGVGEAAIGANDVLLQAKKMGGNIDEVAHLLRGYSGRLCHHLVSMTRADTATLYWLDYAQNPPHLVHAGGYARDLMHRAYRQEIHKKFDDWSYSVENTEPAKQRNHSQSLAYRVAFIRQAELAISEEQAYFAAYKDYGDICSGLGLPLLVNDRVVGVLTLTGKNKGQFNKRLFPALQRAAHLIGQVMYQASQMWQMRQLSWLTTHIPYWQWQQHDLENQFNPLQRVSQCLCNILLCRAVHIWLQDDADVSLYKLHGYNMQDVFPNLTVTPLFEYQKNKQQSKEYVSLERAFACFALDAVGSANDSLGCFQVAVYYSEQDNNRKTQYSPKNANAGMHLFKDFTDISEKENALHADCREKIFEEQKLNHMMTCVLLQDTQEHDTKRQYKPMGVLTLHDTYKSEQPSDSDTLIASEWPWSQAWRPVVAHVQTWLPNLLMQIEVRHSPLDYLRRVLLHSVRGELLAVQNEIQLLRDQANTFAPDAIIQTHSRKLKGLINKLLETPHLETERKKSIRDEGAYRSLAIERSVQSAWFAINNLLSGQRRHNIEKMIIGIEKLRDLTQVGIDISAPTEKFSLQENLEHIIQSNESIFKNNGVYPAKLSYRNGFGRDVHLCLESLWWDQLITTLIENAGKYAKETFDVSWDHKNHCLIFENMGDYNPSLDTVERLQQLGVRGSAATDSEQRGMGVGLWGAKLICELLKIQFNFEIESDPIQKTLAAYRVKLTLPKQVIV